MRLELILDDGTDSARTLVIDNPSLISEFLRRAAAAPVTDDDRTVLVGFAHRCSALAKQKRTVQKVQKAREGERIHGEPVVILDSGFCDLVELGEELSLSALDERAGFKYPATSMALQRAKVAGEKIAELSQSKEITDQKVAAVKKALATTYGDKDGLAEFVKWSSTPDKYPPIRFCRVSSLIQIAEQFPEAVLAWNSQKENQ